MRRFLAKYDKGSISIENLVIVLLIVAFITALTYLVTSIFKLKFSQKSFITFVAFIISLMGILANIGGAISLFEKIIKWIKKIFGKDKHLPTSSEELPKRLRILMVMPRPLNEAQLANLSDPEKFVDPLKEIKAPAKIDFVRPPTFEKFEEKILNGYDIIHFDGHGFSDGLAFENESGLKELISAERFANVLNDLEKSQKPKLIILSACSTAKGKNSFAHKIHKLTKISVIAFTDLVSVHTTMEFSRRFYQKIASGKKLSETIKSIKNAMELTSLKFFGKGKQKFVRVGDKGEVEVETMEWFNVPNPLQTPMFIGVYSEDGEGRYNKIYDILNWVLKNRVKLILLYGDGGFGKTAIAYESARRLAPYFRGGVLWFDGKEKEKITLGSFIDDTFGTEIEEIRKKPVEDKKKLVIQYLRDKTEKYDRVLIVADNMDFALKETWEFLLSLPERCSVIATSRSTPDVPAISQIRVNELTLGEAKIMLRAMLDEAFKVDESKLDVVVKLTGGMPAVLEFCASDINNREIGIDKTIENLKKYPSRKVEDRFDFTYEPLNEDTKHFLWALSIFPAGFIPEVHIKTFFEKLSNEDQPPIETNWREIWQELEKRKQWIRVSEEKRKFNFYEMHPIVRDYLRRKAKKTDSHLFDRFERRFVLVMLSLVYKIESQLQSGGAYLYVQIASLERENFIQAQRIAYEKSMWDEVISFAYRLDRIFNRSGDWDDMVEVLKLGLEASKKLKNKRNEANMFGNLGTLAWSQGRYVEAESYYREALKIFKELKDEKGLANTLMGFGILASDWSRYVEAESYYREALKIFKELKDEKGLANTLMNLGNLALSQGKYQEAEDYYRKAMKKFKKLRDKKEWARTLVNLGILVGSQGRYVEAEGYYKEALNMFKELGDEEGRAGVFTNLGVLSMSQNRYEKAESYYREALNMFKELGNKKGLADVLGNLGTLARSQDRYEEAEKYYWKAIEKFKELGDKKGWANTFMGLGNLASDQGGDKEAKGYYIEALNIFVELDDLEGIANALLNLGVLADKLGKLEIAFKLTTVAFSFFMTMKHRNIETASQNLAKYAQKLNYTKEKFESEMQETLKEFHFRGSEFVMELIDNFEETLNQS